VAVGARATNPAEVAPQSAAATAAPPALATGTTVAATRVREPAVAGLFYPRDAAGLSRVIERCLAAAKAEPGGDLRALICPHAGYPYSGPVAAYAYKLLVGREYETVVVLGPSPITPAFPAASVTDADRFRTPLGDVPISAKARALAKLTPFALEPRLPGAAAGLVAAILRVLRTGRRHRGHLGAFRRGRDPVPPENPEGLPLVPVVMGEADPAKAAKALGKSSTISTLIVASSDLSHYYSYATAQEASTSAASRRSAISTSIRWRRRKPAAGFRSSR
jgi:hypothetical protein